MLNMQLLIWLVMFGNHKSVAGFKEVYVTTFKVFNGYRMTLVAQRSKNFKKNKDFPMLFQC